MNDPLNIELPTRRATIHLASRLGPLLRDADLVVLEGPLGSGKTFLVRALSRTLKLPETERVTSPTFILLQELPTVPPLIHADLYRLQTPEDVKNLGLRSLRDEGHLVIVEWGKPYIQDLGGDALLVELSVDPRRAVLSSTGPRSQDVLAALRARAAGG